MIPKYLVLMAVHLDAIQENRHSMEKASIICCGSALSIKQNPADFSCLIDHLDHACWQAYLLYYDHLVGRNDLFY
jgi:hypothetical protein